MPKGGKANIISVTKHVTEGKVDMVSVIKHVARVIVHRL